MNDKVGRIDENTVGREKFTKKFLGLPAQSITFLPRMNDKKRMAKHVWLNLIVFFFFFKILCDYSEYFEGIQKTKSFK